MKKSFHEEAQRESVTFIYKKKGLSMSLKFVASQIHELTNNVRALRCIVIIGSGLDWHCVRYNNYYCDIRHVLYGQWLGDGTMVIAQW